MDTAPRGRSDVSGAVRVVDDRVDILCPSVQVTPVPGFGNYKFSTHGGNCETTKLTRRSRDSSIKVVRIESDLSQALLAT